MISGATLYYDIRCNFILWYPVQLYTMISGASSYYDIRCNFILWYPVQFYTMISGATLYYDIRYISEGIIMMLDRTRQNERYKIIRISGTTISYDIWWILAGPEMGNSSTLQDIRVNLNNQFKLISIWSASRESRVNEGPTGLVDSGHLMYHTFYIPEGFGFGFWCCITLK